VPARISPTSFPRASQRPLPATAAIGRPSAITEALRALPFRRVMLDGEAVSHCLNGLPDFHKLMSRDGQATACLYAFDLIWLEAQDLRGVELIGRRRCCRRR
jgi:ATP-dependent DNA ligase